LRIVAGKHRGRPLAAPAGKDIRPTSDRAREGLFNILEHGRFAAERNLTLEGARVLDAFAGTGALGLEALSRGANHATFIENAREARRTLEQNIATCDENERTEIINTDATKPPPVNRTVDIAFLDPPYKAGMVEPTLTALERRGWFGDDTLIIVETGAGEKMALPNFLEELDRRKYGAAQIIFLARRGPAQ
jgi:16S rRNA (guanine966-N2)-methyltransferase